MSRLAGIYAQTPLNRSDIAQSALNITNKSRSNRLRWKGQFSPQLVEVLLKRYAALGAVVFDPFLGSGTLLLEAGLIGLAASGTEINPAAVRLAQIYRFINVPLEVRRYHLKEISLRLQRDFLPTLPLFQQAAHSEHREDSQSVKSRLLELSWLTPDPLQCQLLKTLMVLLDFCKADLSTDKVFKVWRKLSRVVVELPFSEAALDIFHADARQTPLPDSSVDLVVTSPPYINVFNYHQQYRGSMEALNWNLLRVAKSEIGANRKHRGNRFLTVIQFCLDIAQVLNEVARVCRPNGRVILVVGRQSNVRRTPFFNSEMVAEVANRALGFPDLILRQERVFVNRFGKQIFEDILHFSPPINNRPAGKFLCLAQEVAQDVLQTAIPYTPDKAKEGIRSALKKIDTIQPSPLFNLN